MMDFNFVNIFERQQKIAELYEPIVKGIDTSVISSMTDVIESMKPTLEFMQHNQEIIRGIGDLYDSVMPALKIQNEIMPTISNLYSELNVNDWQKNFHFPDENFLALQENLKVLTEKENFWQNNLIDNLQDYSGIIDNLGSLGCDLTNLVCDTYNKLEFDDTDNVEDIFQSEVEVAEAIQEQFENPKSFQERFYDWSEEKKRQYYVVYIMVMFILLQFITPYFQDTIGKPVMAYVVSKVKELPEKVGKAVDILEENKKAIITEDVPYYYKVTYEDEEGNIREGYVAKRNLKIIEEDNTEEFGLTEE